jgi:NDP-mannose synthase
MRALILAGGRGQRLEPFTTVFPKPLAPVGEMPIIEVVMRQLAAAGFDDAVVSIGYLGWLIRAYLDTIGGIPGLRLEWLEEETPLGTVGPAGLLANRDEPVLTTNADILSDLDHRAFTEFFLRERPAMAVAVAPREQQVEFGVLQTDERGDVQAWVEKPRSVHLCSMGVNWLGPQALAAIEPGERLDIPDLVQRLVERGERVATWQWTGYWRDIGRWQDFDLAQRELFPERVVSTSPRSGPEGALLAAPLTAPPPPPAAERANSPRSAPETGPVRFAIVSEGRSGSTMLQRLLDSHPGITCQGELADSVPGWADLPSAEAFGDYLDAVWPADHPGCAGFRFMLRHWVACPGAWEVLERRGYRLIVNRRRNKLDQYLSMRLAQVWNEWSSRRQYPETRLNIEVAHLLEKAAEWAGTDEDISVRASRFPAVHCVYEDVRRGVGLPAIQRFLGVEPARLAPDSVRARWQPRRELIENFDEVVAVLRGTPWENDPFAAE